MDNFSLYSILLQRSAQLPDLASTLATNTNIHKVSIPYPTTTATTTATTTTTTATTNATNTNTVLTSTALIHACVFASTVSKKAAELAFSTKGRSMTAPDVIEHIGQAFVYSHLE